MIPVRDPHHLPAVRAAHLLFLNETIRHFEAPVVSPFGPNPQKVRTVMVFSNDLRIVKQKICLKHIGIGQKITGHQRRRDIIRLIIERVFQKPDHGILVKQLVKLLREIAPDDVDFLNPRFQTCINQAVNNSLTVYPHKRLGRVQRDRYKPCSEAGGNEHSSLCLMRLHRVQTAFSNSSV